MSKHTPPGGPYCDDDLRRWWMAVEDCGYLEARREVKATTTADLYWDQKLVYVGKQTVYLWDGEEHSHDDDDEEGDSERRCEVEGCRYVEAWAFEVVER